MTERVLLCISLALLCPDAAAVGKGLGPKRSQPTLQKYAADLTSDSAAKRSYAGRVLLSRVKTARRQAATGPEDDLTRAEALQVLTDFDRLVAPVCTRHLAVPEITAPCADILRYLESADALTALKAQLARETRKRIKKRLEQAIAHLEKVPK